MKYIVLPMQEDKLFLLKRLTFLSTCTLLYDTFNVKRKIIFPNSRKYRRILKVPRKQWLPESNVTALN